MLSDKLFHLSMAFKVILKNNVSFSHASSNFHAHLDIIIYRQEAIVLSPKSYLSY